MTDEQVEEYAERLLMKTREELQRADQKAALLLAAAGVVAGALINGFINGKWVPYQLPAALQVCWWVGISAAVLGIGFIGSAVYPRTTRSGAAFTGVAYFGDVVDSGADRLRADLRRTLEEHQSPYVDQLFQTSDIVVKKYRGIRNGLQLLSASTLLCTIAILLSSLPVD